KLDDEEQELIDRISELTDEYNSWAESRDEVISDTGAEFDYYKQLSDELQTITDKNGEVKKGYEDRAEFIVTTLNDSLGTEIEMNDGVIQKYEDVISTIDEVIEKKRAEAMLSAYEQTYADAIANVGEAQKAYYDETEKLNKLKGEMVPIQSALNDLEHMSADEIERAYKAYAEENNISATYGDVKAELTAKLEGLNRQLTEQETALNDAKTAYFEYNGAIQNYEGLSSAIISGDTTAINDALLKMTEGFLTAETADAESLQRQTEDLESQIQSMEQALRDGMPGVTQEQIDQLKNLRDQSSIEWGKAVDDAGQAVQDMGGAISENKGEVTSAAADVASGVKNEMHVDGSSDGDYYMSTYADGLDSGGQKAIMTVSSLMDTMSRLTNGFEIDTSITNVVASAKANLAGHAKGGIVTREHVARVGEDGAEAIVPLENNTEWIDKVAAKFTASMGGAPSNAAILNKLNELIDTIKAQKVYLDSGTLVGEIAPAMDSALGNISKLKRRGVK
ncbi:hypothetical protein, partial [Porcipelethomonas sp.]|uniref:hypothetical protein n=1 Tax=Porcipelethomonas sp. TaxID=2981675 RepID=UPI003EF6E793